MKDKFEKHACEFKNESKCEEELDSIGTNIKDAEKEFYEEN